MALIVVFVSVFHLIHPRYKYRCILFYNTHNRSNHKYVFLYWHSKKSLFVIQFPFLYQFFLLWNTNLFNKLFYLMHDFIHRLANIIFKLLISYINIIISLYGDIKTRISYNWLLFVAFIEANISTIQVGCVSFYFMNKSVSGC